MKTQINIHMKIAGRTQLVSWTLANRESITTELRKKENEL